MDARLGITSGANIHARSFTAELSSFANAHVQRTRTLTPHITQASTQFPGTDTQGQ
jgi:hypothetical protein